MTSCGFLPVSGGETDDYDGAYQELSNGEETCFAQNGDGGAGVDAWPRCCDFSHLGDVECFGLRYAEFANNFEDGLKTSTCPGEFPFLTGCLFQSHWAAFDGSYPSWDVPGGLVLYQYNLYAQYILIITFYILIICDLALKIYIVDVSDGIDYDLTSQLCTTVHGSSSM